jgi:hypothetical protein
MARFGFIRVLPVLVLLAATGVDAAEPEAGVTAVPALYVGEFRPVEQAPQGRGPLRALNSDYRRVKADRNAARFSAALVEALQKQGLKAAALPEDPSLRPRAGWLIRGVYYALDENSRLISLPLSGSDKGPNVEVSVTVADCAQDPDVPFAVIGSDSALKGQGTPASWNPYVAAAKFVVHRVQGEDSLAQLAAEIARKILAVHADLLAHDPLTPDAASTH